MPPKTGHCPIRWPILVAGARGKSIVHELQQSRVLFAIHGHHFQKQAVRAGVDALLEVSNATQVAGSSRLFLD
jgi:hypothetical protein